MNMPRRRYRQPKLPEMVNRLEGIEDYANEGEVLKIKLNGRSNLNISFGDKLYPWSRSLRLSKMCSSGKRED